MNGARKQLLRRIQVYSFAVNEAMLYLDTHPNDRAALTYFDKYRTLLREAKHSYEDQYGPLTACGAKTDCAWSWVLEPWPWEYDGQ